MLYPLKFKPIFKPKLWGGTELRTYFGKKTPDGNIGESWELCCMKEGMSIVENGRYQGKALQKMIDLFRERLLGSEIVEKYGTRFPLLIKILDANQKLSVQVHPDDSYAVSHGLNQGKDEMWYIIDAKKNASLVYGLKNGTSKTILEKAIREKQIPKLLHEVTVKPGDFFYIPAGTVHAILGGILIAEIQQNCNTTYRLYDWDRVDSAGKKRELHIHQALDTIHFREKHVKSPLLPVPENRNGAWIRKGPNVKEFRVDEIRTRNSFDIQTNLNSFQVLMNLKGNGKLLYSDGCLELNKGDTVLIPAETGKYGLRGNVLTLLTHLPAAS